MIRAQGIEKHYGDLQVLKGVDFEAQAAEIVTIVGASGAGKTTFLQILGTLENPDKGTLTYQGENILQRNAKKLAQFRNEHIGFIFQFHHLLPEFTALENVCIPAYIGKKKKSETEKRAAELLDFLGLSERMDHKPSQMSGGEQQRVAVARALINNPDMILADEPTGNLDSKNAEEMHRLFFQLRDEFKSTFIVITHNKELAELGDRQLTMADGILLS
ncbi:MAG: lipoprotein-releasing system ATP-binding protein LolD [Owenweeksia sp.]|nr:lipoprotein-releasing system ATP-binding protein LolD [Owenweeksia sp.]MBF98054.1 lipoprotein-releasing system ATP-binding protein LolD [Owenweeksia sp.]HCQ16072.1 lipoprotein-releasing system ATP-binding protein LolD [Cryomorphaceae bacterium]|tara:strand:- start:367 stop:1020 length:654 start_codon:yes stop_codon:yes gene_type:complete